MILNPLVINNPFCLRELSSPEHIHIQPGDGFLLPVVQEDSVSVDLVLQGEVEGEVFDAFAVVDLHSGGVLVGLKVLDDVREPHREPVEPGHSNSFWFISC